MMIGLLPSTARQETLHFLITLPEDLLRRSFPHLGNCQCDRQYDQVQEVRASLWDQDWSGPLMDRTNLVVEEHYSYLFGRIGKKLNLFTRYYTLRCTYCGMTQKCHPTLRVEKAQLKA